MTVKQPYDGFFKYDKTVAGTYESDRLCERHWQQEDRFIKNYLARKKIERLLDLPVGTGRFLPYFGGVKHLVGIDISDDMLEEARTRGRETPKGGTTLFEKGDVVTLPYTTGYFDVTIVCRLFHLLPPDILPKAIASLCNVSKSDVVVQSYNPTRPEHWSLFDRMNAYLSRAAAKKIVKQASKPASPELPWSHIQSFNHERRELDEGFKSCGFKVHQTKLIDVYGTLDVRMTVYRRAV